MSWAPQLIRSAHADPGPTPGPHHRRNPEHDAAFAHKLQTVKGNPQQFRIRGFTAQEKAFTCSPTTLLPTSWESLPEGQDNDDSGAGSPAPGHRLGR